MRKPRQVIFNIPDYIYSQNLEGTLVAQNPDIRITKLTSKQNFATQQKTEEKFVHGNGSADQKAADTNVNQPRVKNMQNLRLFNSDEMLQTFKV